MATFTFNANSPEVTGTSGVTKVGTTYQMNGTSAQIDIIADAGGGMAFDHSTALESVSDNLWTPADLTTELWLDASDASTVTESGGAVSAWNDKSGNSRNLTQDTPANQPTYTTGGLGGNNIMTLDGSDFFDGTIPIPNTADDLLIYFVGNPNAIGAYHNMYENSGGNPMVWVQSSNKWEMNTSRLVIDGYIGTDHIAGFRTKTTGPSSSFWGNGGTIQTGGSSLSSWPSSNMKLFNRNGGACYNGTVGELIFIDGSVPESDRLKLEGYLAWKWGLEGKLPSDHPYKNSEPMT